MKSIISPLIQITPALLAPAAIAGLPNVVSIEGFRREPVADAKAEGPINRCLGFIVEEDGFLLTSYKNLTDPASGQLLDEFSVRVSGKSAGTYPATLIGVDPTIDMGILKIQSDERFTVSKIARNKPVTLGARLAAVKSLSLQETPEINQGTVAGLNTRQCYQQSLTSTMFRAKMEIPMASVGGPVFFKDSGEVAALFTGYKPIPEQGHTEVEGETHLLPIELCFNIYDSIKQKGSLKSPWTGFSVRALNETELKFFPTPKTHQGGIAIEHVWENSPAQKLGIKENDILVQFSYNRIMNVGDFQKWLYMYGVGHPVKLMILRNGREYFVADYVIEERPQWAKPK